MSYRVTVLLTMVNAACAATCVVVGVLVLERAPLSQEAPGTDTTAPTDVLERRVGDLDSGVGAQPTAGIDRPELVVGGDDSDDTEGHGDSPASPDPSEEDAGASDPDYIQQWRDGLRPRLSDGPRPDEPGFREFLVNELGYSEEQVEEYRYAHSLSPEEFCEVLERMFVDLEHFRQTDYRAYLDLRGECTGLLLSFSRVNPAPNAHELAWQYSQQYRELVSRLDSGED